MDEKERSVKIWYALWIGFFTGTGTQITWFLIPAQVPRPWLFAVIMVIPTASVFAWASVMMARDRGTG